MSDGVGMDDFQGIRAPEFLDCIPAGAYQVDDQGNFLYCNQEAASILGYDSPEELMQKNIYDLFFDPRERDKLLKRMRRMGGRIKTEICLKRKNGLEVVISDFSEIIYENGEEAGIRGMFVDATHQRLFDNLNAGVFRIGPDMYTVQRVNKAVARIFGFESPEEMEGKDIREFYRADEGYEEFMKILKENGEIEDHPLEMKRINGDLITISVNCRLLKDDKGEIVGREGTFTDITDKKRYEKLLELPLGIYEAKLRDGVPIISSCNSAFAKMFGYTFKDDMIGMNINDLYAFGEDIQEFDNKLKEKDKLGKPLIEYLLEVKRKIKGKKTTEKFWIEIFCYPEKDDAGEIVGRKGIVMDVTDRVVHERILYTRKDIQRFIHGFISPMMSICATTEVLAKEVERGVGIKYGTENMDRFREIKNSTLTLYEEIGGVSERLIGKLEETLGICEDEGGLMKMIFEISPELRNL